MFLNKNKKPIIIIINIAAIVTLADSSHYYYCHCTGSQIHIFPTHQDHNGNCCVASLMELLHNNNGASEFIVHQGLYTMSKNIEGTGTIPVKKDGLTQIDIVGEQGVTVKCEETFHLRLHEYLVNP